MPPRGTCAICGKTADLTAEHIPPKSAFNDYPVLELAVANEGSQRAGELAFCVDRTPDSRFLHRLCAKCNNRTGSWYGTDYRDFVRAAAESRIPPDATGHLGFRGRPAAVAKQALAIICTSSGEGLTRNAPQIKRLILENKYCQHPRGFRLWCYLTTRGGGHQTGIAGVANVYTGRTRVIAEFSHWPVGWVLSWNDAAVPKLCEVTHWLAMDYKRQKDVLITIPCLWTTTGFPLDYRSPDQVVRDSQQAIA